MLNEKIALVTGGGSGIGRATSLKMAGYGAKLVIVDFNEAGGQETVRLIQEQGGEAIFVQADVSKAEDVQRYVQAAVDAFGRIDVFFNNSGIVQKFNRLADIEESEFDRIMSVNVRGVFLGMKYVLKVMEQQGGGSIVNTASTAGVKSEHSASAYSASKHAVVGLTKGAAIEYVKKGIRVNAICPGGVETALTKGVEAAFLSGGYVPEEVGNMRMGRYAQPDELAEVACFLASDRASYMTGSIVVADGGLTL
ncbi:glucose 1-dehydrogenase [Paenibacillus sp. FSL W8-1187]|uniref:SDR family NAD(P)-dependent oxidoreductase n=1 Tax=Paenibacillus sp. FSL W8-1187 TaxID=2975339 RepID=UPI0030D89260